jgi:hypothetical protein
MLLTYVPDNKFIKVGDGNEQAKCKDCGYILQLCKGGIMMINARHHMLNCGRLLSYFTRASGSGPLPPMPPPPNKELICRGWHKTTLGGVSTQPLLRQSCRGNNWFTSPFYCYEKPMKTEDGVAISGQNVRIQGTAFHDDCKGYNGDVYNNPPADHRSCSRCASIGEEKDFKKKVVDAIAPVNK